MIILLAESKTMSPKQNKVDEDTYSQHIPMFETEAEEIVDFLSHLNIHEFSERVGISARLASKAMSMIYDFPNKSMGLEAIHAFTGEVFRALDINSLPRDALLKTKKNIFIISSLYGLLRSDDIIKPYRLDYMSPCAPQGKKISTFWRKRLTDSIISLIKDRNDSEVLDLLPGEAARCLDMDELRKHAMIEKVGFKTVSDGGKLTTPYSGRLKELRGLLIREIIINGIDRLDDVRSIESGSFAPYDSEDKGMLFFIA